jgi:hypothetical protein
MHKIADPYPLSGEARTSRLLIIDVQGPLIVVSHILLFGVP